MTFEIHDRRMFYIPVLDVDYEAADEITQAEIEEVIEALENGDPDPPKHYKVEVNTVTYSNLIASETTNGKHRPVLDIDFAARLLPSKTEGHFHLYLDGIELEWGDYEKLLNVLAEVGILEEGYVNASIERGMTRVRTPQEYAHKPVPHLTDEELSLEDI